MLRIVRSPAPCVQGWVRHYRGSPGESSDSPVPAVRNHAKRGLQSARNNGGSNLSALFAYRFVSEMRPEFRRSCDCPLKVYDRWVLRTGPSAALSRGDKLWRACGGYRRSPPVRVDRCEARGRAFSVIHSMTSSATLSHDWSARLAFALRPRSVLSALSVSTRSSVAAKSLWFPGSNNRPFSPCVMMSLCPQHEEATEQRPKRIACSKESGAPSK